MKRPSEGEMRARGSGPSGRGSLRVRRRTNIFRSNSSARRRITRTLESTRTSWDSRPPGRRFSPLHQSRDVSRLSILSPARLSSRDGLMLALRHSTRARAPRPPPLVSTPAMASSAATVSASATYAGASLTRRRASARASRASRFVVRAAEDAKADEPFDARAFRRELSKMPNYNRKFAKDEESAEAMESAGIGMVSKGACRGRATRIVPRSRAPLPAALGFRHPGARAATPPPNALGARSRAGTRVALASRIPIPPTLARARRPPFVLPDLRSRSSSSPPPDLPRVFFSSQAASSRRCAPRASSTSRATSR